jgi:hypothetical protein
MSGADKARVLIEKIRRGVLGNPVISTRTTEYGQRYDVDLPVTGPNGKTAIVRTGWIFDQQSSRPRLVTLFVC